MDKKIKKVGIEKLTELFNEINKYKEALIWCGGSDDFQVGGRARRGWEIICIPLLESKIKK